MSQALGQGVGGFAPMAFSALGLPALLSFAPALLQRIFGGNPQRELRRRLNQLSSAGNIGRTTNQFYQQNLASPAFAQAQGGIAAGANQTQANLGRELGARGIGTSGTGAILSSIIPSIVGGQQAGLRTSAFSSAQQQANEQIQRQIAALLGTQGPSPTQQMFAGGLESFGPFLQQWLRARYPQFGASSG